MFFKKKMLLLWRRMFLFSSDITSPRQMNNLNLNSYCRISTKYCIFSLKCVSQYSSKIVKMLGELLADNMTWILI